MKVYTLYIHNKKYNKIEKLLIKFFILIFYLLTNNNF